MVKYNALILVLIIILGAIFRLYGINWDQGYSFHPDERAIVMFTLPVHLPSNIDEFLKPSSPLNPHFFAYGNLPIYLLKTTGVIASFIDNSILSYGNIQIAGRLISVIADLGTIIFLYFLAKKIFNPYIGLIASFFYAVSIFPIQASHFYAVDILLTFFILLTLYQLLRFYKKPSFKNSLFVGILFGLSLSTKISAAVLLSAIILTISVDLILIFIKQPHKPKLWFLHIPVFLKQLILKGFIIILGAVITFIISQPYAIIDFQEFLKQNLLQSEMTKNAYIFPYTLQYVGKTPYFYELKNIFLWGLGPILASLSFIGFFYFIYAIFQKGKKETISKEIIIVLFFLIYFSVVGKFAVGWMRYMLPVYPLLSLFAAVFTYEILQKIKIKFNYWYLFVVFVLICSILIWPLSFVNIYSKPNTRVLASNWINKNITAGKTLAVEHWDDRVPLYGGEKYNFMELTLYDQPDNEFKWNILNSKLRQSDYIIIASNRLYVPLQELDDCIKYKSCYPKTSEYYKKLFNEQLGFKKVAEFSSNPTIPILNIEIDDQTADESFTVYDHPKVIIFKKL